MLEQELISKLLSKAKKAFKNSYAPHTNSRRGAAIVNKKDEIFIGTEIENQIWDLSMCAERVALFSALSDGAKDYKALAVICEEDSCIPCGACLQALKEYAPEIEIITANINGDYKVNTLDQLLTSS